MTLIGGPKPFTEVRMRRVVVTQNYRCFDFRDSINVIYNFQTVGNPIKKYIIKIL